MQYHVSCVLSSLRLHRFVYYKSLLLLLLLLLLSSLSSLLLLYHYNYYYHHKHYDHQVLFICFHITNITSHYDHYANLSEGIELIKCPLGVFCQVCV